MRIAWSLILSFMLLSFFCQGCSASKTAAVRKVYDEEAFFQGGSEEEVKKTLAKSGKGEKVPGREDGPAKNQEIPPSNVKEVTPATGEGKTYLTMSVIALSKKDYIRARFPGKKVIFPDELKPIEKKPEYHIGPDDVLNIMVWNHPDLTAAETLVRKDGRISLPLVGNIKAEGLTIPELEGLLKKEFNRFIQNPQVTVNPKEMNSQRVFLLGQYSRQNTGRGPVGPSFLLKEGKTLLEALSDVDFDQETDLAASYIARGDIIIPVNIRALLMEGDFSQNVLLESGDRIVIASPMKEVNILGEVQAPNRYKVKMDATLLDALSLARGIKRESADLYMAYVSRNNKILPVNLKRLLELGDMNQNMVMEDGDIIYIPSSDEKKYYILGEVSKPGVIYFKDPVDVIEAIAQSGGFLTTAQRRQVVVVRGDIRSPKLYEINILAMMQGKSFERFTLQKGDVVYIPRTYIADWNVFLNQLFPTFQGIILLDLLRR